MSAYGRTPREPVPINGCGCPDAYTMLRQLGAALGRDLPEFFASPSPEQAWSDLLDEVERLKRASRSGVHVGKGEGSEGDRDGS